MVNIVTRLRKDLQELTDMDEMSRKVDRFERELGKLDAQVREIVKEMDRISRKTASMTNKGGPKRQSLAKIVEEIFEANGGGPMKVTEVKKILLKEKKVKTRAKNFYAVITVSLNNNPRFKKTAPGEYKLTSATAKKSAAKKPAAKKSAAKKKKKAAK